jgi:hypothetical protein
MTTTDAIELRQKLERDILTLLGNFSRATGYVVSRVDVRTHTVENGTGVTRTLTTGVRVTVEG